MKKFILVLFLSISGTCHSFNVKTLKANKRVQVCSPANSSIPGRLISSDFGKTFQSCTDFTCSSGFNISGSTCVAAPTYNVTCANDEICTTANYYNQTTNYNGTNIIFTRKLNCPQSTIDMFIMGTFATESGNAYGTPFTYTYTSSIPSYIGDCSINRSCNGTGTNFTNPGALKYYFGCTEV